MLLGNADVIEPFGKFLFKGRQAGALAHRGGNRHNPLVLAGQPDQRIDGNLGIGRSGRLLRRGAGFPNERRTGMEPHRILFGRLVAQPFFGDHVQQDRAFHLQHILKGRQKMFEVVPVDGTGIAETQLFKEQSGKNGAFGQLFRAPGKLLDVVPDVRNLPQQLPGFFPHFCVEISGKRPVQIGGNGTHVFGDRHLIVVEDHEEVFAEPPGMVQPLEGHTGGHGAVTDHADHLMLQPLLLPGLDHAIGSGNARAGMTRVERIVNALLALAEAAQSPVLPKGMKLLPPSR